MMNKRETNKRKERKKERKKERRIMLKIINMSVKRVVLYNTYIHDEKPRKKFVCTNRESNPGLMLGRHAFCH